MKRNFVCSRAQRYVFMFFLVPAVLFCEGSYAVAQYTSMKIFPEHVGVFTVDGKQQFVAFGYDAQGRLTNITKEVGWKSSNEKLVTIDENGVARIVGSVTAGRVKISATYPKTEPQKVGINVPVLKLLLRNPK